MSHQARMKQRGAAYDLGGQIMTPAYSIYLDLVRFIAALAVYLDHLSAYPFSRDVKSNWQPLLDTYGGTAVVIFFVLSGYVIAYVASTRETTPIEYASSRIARLYSVVVLALVLTYAFDSLGMSLNPEFYRIQKVLWKPESWAGYLSSAIFVNEFQVFRFNGIVPGTNAPYWSLSFEATYYLLAGLMLFARRRLALPMSAVILVFAGRTITALLPIWVLGFALYRGRTWLRWRIPAPGTVCGGSAIVILLIPAISIHLPADYFGVVFPWGRGPFNRNLLGDYATAIAFGINLLATRQMLTQSTAVPTRIGIFIKWLGGLSFPMYAIHYPALCLFAAISPWPRATPANMIFVSTAVGLLIVLVTPICDLQKVAIRNRLRQLFGTRRSTVAL